MSVPVGAPGWQVSDATPPAHDAVHFVAMNEGFTPRTAGLTEPDPGAQVRHADGGRADIRYTLSSSFGFGGNNTALVLERGER